MSDFLSKFNKDKYDDLVTEQEEKKAQDKQEKSKAKEEDKPKETEQVKKQEKQASTPEADVTVPEDNKTFQTRTFPARSSKRWDTEEEVEIDPGYRKKRRLQMVFIIAGSIIACLLIFFIYYTIVHVKIEDFVDQPVSEARAWAKENGIEVDLTQEHSMEYEVNRVISQEVAAGKKVRKGKKVTLISSLGPDPDETIPLADFSEMSQVEAETWIHEHQAENLRMVTEYNDKIEAGSFVKLTIKDTGIDEAEYRRRDSAAIYYSKGKEVFEKNIAIPDFTGSPKEEVEKWAESNEIKMKYKESDSDTIEAGSIISQSKPTDEKVAKRDKMEVVVSVGKATVVPNFAGLTGEEAASNYPDLDVTVQYVFHAEAAYGTLISQSIKADTKLTESDDHRVTVTYSQGRPYLRDARGLLEGDLPKLFYEEYQSKGANIKYTVKFIDSAEVKGTVVKMSKFNEFVPMTYTVEMSISNNTLAPPSPPDYFEDDPDEPLGNSDGPDVHEK